MSKEREEGGEGSRQSGPDSAGPCRLRERLWLLLRVRQEPCRVLSQGGKESDLLFAKFPLDYSRDCRGLERTQGALWGGGCILRLGQGWWRWQW